MDLSKPILIAKRDIKDGELIQVKMKTTPKGTQYFESNDFIPYPNLKIKKNFKK